MTTVTAQLNNYRQSPRKVRLVANLIKGKKVSEAFDLLGFVTKAATLPIKKLLKSAVVNAKNNNGIEVADLSIKDIQVNAGVVLKRSMPRARGSAFPILKRTSHIKVVLEEQPKIEKSKIKNQNDRAKTIK